MRNNRRIRLPGLQAVEFNAFSLYHLRPTATIEIDRNVFCLAGANGLGKSTFIAAINHALTGGVAPPRPRIDQLSRYVRDAAAYGDKYFSGRIGELDRDVASVSLRFMIGESAYFIRRRFFRPFELEEFSITSSTHKESVSNDSMQDAESRQKDFEEHIVFDTGLQTYAQFVFLQHFVFSFDEHRHLLFWDTRATELVLYLALGLDPTMARRVDELRKAESVEGSGARNAQYQATLARNELKEVLEKLNPGTSIDKATLAQYGNLQSERDRLTVERDLIRSEIADARLELAESSAKLMRTREEYEHAFAQYMQSSNPAGHLHPRVTQLLSNHACSVCGTEHQEIPPRVRAALDANTCPLCDATFDLAPANGAGTRREILASLDQELAKLSAKVSASSAATKRLDTELRASQVNIAAVIKKMNTLDDAHGSALSLSISGPDPEGLQSRALQLQGAVEIALGRKEEHLQRRKEIIAEYQPIQAALKSAWADAEMEFVPRFRAIAEDFIGLPLEISLATGEGISATAHLVLSVDNSHRRRSEQLSESQRFFLDIALRMSLAQHMAGEGSNCLLVDTPEGALDIAYEARAGDMFATFATQGGQIVMTANVNTSQLLVRLAERCGNRDMRLARMTDWTTLSDVQVREEALFERAFETIELALSSGGLGA